MPFKNSRNPFNNPRWVRIMWGKHSVPVDLIRKSTHASSYCKRGQVPPGCPLSVESLPIMSIEDIEKKSEWFIGSRRNRPLVSLLTTILGAPK